MSLFKRWPLTLILVSSYHWWTSFPLKRKIFNLRLIRAHSCTTVVSKFTVLIQSERVKSDVDFVQKSLKETIVPEVSCIYIAVPCTPNNHSFFCTLASLPMTSRSVAVSLMFYI